MQPGAERPAAVEAVEGAHGREECLLRDVLGGGGVVNDEVGGTVGARPVLAKEGLEIRGRSTLGTSDPGTLCHPTTLRRKLVTRSIRDRDLARSRARIRVMKLLALCALVIGTCTPSAPGAGCSPMTCGTSQVTLAHGNLLGVRASGTSGPLRVLDLRTGATRWRLPSGVLGGNLLVHQDGTLLTWFNAATGARAGDAVAQARGTFSLAGVSQDGARAVLARTQRKSTTFEIVSRSKQRLVVLHGNNWGFDALSGNRLYLLQYVNNGYIVRLYDLATNKLDPQPLKDAEESALISGVAWVRQSSADGRYVFTVYITPAGKAMVHELDVRTATARCIDLPGSGDFNSATSYALSTDPDGRTLWAVSTGYGKVAAIDIAGARVRDSFGFAPSAPASPIGDAVAASPDGERLAVSDGSAMWFVTFAQHRVVQAQPHVAIALGFSPNGKQLWTVGQKSRVTAVPVP